MGSFAVLLPNANDFSLAKQYLGIFETGSPNGEELAEPAGPNRASACAAARVSSPPMQTYRASSEESSTLVHWLTVNYSLLNARTNAEILPLVVSGRTSGTRKLVSKRASPRLQAFHGGRGP